MEANAVSRTSQTRESSLAANPRRGIFARVKEGSWAILIKVEALDKGGENPALLVRLNS